MIGGERAGAGVRGSRSPKYEVGVANVVRLCARACDIVSEPDPRKIEKEGLAHRPGWKCTLRPV